MDRRKDRRYVQTICSGPEARKEEHCNEWSELGRVGIGFGRDVCRIAGTRGTGTERCAPTQLIVGFLGPRE